MNRRKLNRETQKNCSKFLWRCIKKNVRILFYYKMANVKVWKIWWNFGGCQNWVSISHTQGVPKGTGKFFFISLKSVSSAIFFTNFGNTVNLSFNGLIGVNSLCSIYFTKDTKKKRTAKFIWELSNFLILLKLAF